MCIENQNHVGEGFNPNGDYEGWIARLPARCGADITGDGAIDVDDLLELINGWGPCP